MSDSTNPDSPADDDHWEIYVTYVDDKPAVILVDIGVASIVPLPAQPVLVWLWVHVLKPDDEGFPTEEEDMRLNEVEDVVTEGFDEDARVLLEKVDEDLHLLRRRVRREMEQADAPCGIGI